MCLVGRPLKNLAAVDTRYWVMGAQCTTQMVLYLCLLKSLVAAFAGEEDHVSGQSYAQRLCIFLSICVKEHLCIAKGRQNTMRVQSIHAYDSYSPKKMNHLMGSTPVNC